MINVFEEESNSMSEANTMYIKDKNGNPISISFETITREKALIYLEANVKNRRLSRKVTEYYKEQLLGNIWNWNGSTISFDSTGRLIDGQHRLKMCVDTGIPFETLVIRGLPSESQNTIDTGRLRSAGDQLGIQGHTHCNQLAAAVRMIFFLKKGNMNTPKIPNAVILDFLDRHPKFAEVVAECNNLRSVIPLTTLIVWRYITKYCMSEIVAQQSDAAYEVIKNGVPSYVNDPVHAFRESSLRKKSSKMQNHEKLQWTWTLFGCFDSFRNGEQLSLIRARSAEYLPRGFDREGIEKL